MLHSVELGEGRPVVILHGGGLDHRHMRDALEPVFEGLSGWKRVYLDLPGHGKSPADEALQTQDDVLDRVISHIIRSFPDTPVALIGESRGSYLAEGICAHRPELVSGVCLIAPGGNRPGSPRPDHQTLIATPKLRADMSDALSARFDRLVVQSAALAEKIEKTKLPAASLQDTALATRISENFFWRPSASPSRFDKPALIVSGRQDSIAGYEDAMALLPTFTRASFALLDTAGHSLTWERPALFACLLRDWLARLAGD